MRALFAGLSASAFAAAFAIAACSDADGDIASNDPTDAAEAAPRAVVYPDVEEACDPDADILANVDDAAIGDGASTTGICVACVRERCAEQLASCAEDCPCQGIMGDAIECYLTTQSLACLGRLTNYLVTQDTRARALTLGGCTRSSCPSECAVDGGAEPDATPPDASADAATE